ALGFQAGAIVGLRSKLRLFALSDRRDMAFFFETHLVFYAFAENAIAWLKRWLEAGETGSFVFVEDKGPGLQEGSLSADLEETALPDRAVLAANLADLPAR
ncbi:MAG: hypothetical protein AAFR70_04785, partial [Pseudomonadota bacterium]